MTEPCADCGTQQGRKHKSGRSYIRVDGSPYGFAGTLCDTCYRRYWLRVRRTGSHLPRNDPKPYPACSGCNKPGGEVAPYERVPARMSGEKFGKPGVFCRTCYNRLAYAAQATQEGRGYEPRTVPRVSTVSRPGGSDAYLPSAEEIRRETEAIRLGWTGGQPPTTESRAEQAQRTNARRAELERQAIAMMRRNAMQDESRIARRKVHATAGI